MNNTSFRDPRSSTTRASNPSFGQPRYAKPASQRDGQDQPAPTSAKLAQPKQSRTALAQMQSMRRIERFIVESEKRRSKQRRRRAPTAHSNLDNKEDDITTSDAFPDRTQEDTCIDPTEFQADQEDDSKEQRHDYILDEYPTIFRAGKEVLSEAIDGMALQKNDALDDQFNVMADSKIKVQNQVPSECAVREFHIDALVDYGSSPRFEVENWANSAKCNQVNIWSQRSSQQELRHSSSKKEAFQMHRRSRKDNSRMLNIQGLDSSMTQRCKPTDKQSEKIAAKQRKKIAKKAVDRLSQPKWRNNTTISENMRADTQLDQTVLIHQIGMILGKRKSSQPLRKKQTACAKGTALSMSKLSGLEQAVSQYPSRQVSVARANTVGRQSGKQESCAAMDRSRSFSQRRGMIDEEKGEDSNMAHEYCEPQKFKARPFKLKNKQPFMTMKSTKRLTIPIENKLQTEQRGILKSYKNLPKVNFLTDDQILKLHAEQGSCDEASAHDRSRSGSRSLTKPHQMKDGNSDLEPVNVNRCTRKPIPSPSTQTPRIVKEWEQREKADQPDYLRVQASASIGEHPDLGPVPDYHAPFQQQQVVTNRLPTDPMSTQDLNEQPIFQSEEKQRTLLERKENLRYADLRVCNYEDQLTQPMDSEDRVQPFELEFGLENDTVKKIQPFLLGKQILRDSRAGIAEQTREGAQQMNIDERDERDEAQLDCMINMKQAMELYEIEGKREHPESHRRHLRFFQPEGSSCQRKNNDIDLDDGLEQIDNSMIRGSQEDGEITTSSIRRAHCSKNEQVEVEAQTDENEEQENARERTTENYSNTRPQGDAAQSRGYSII